MTEPKATPETAAATDATKGAQKPRQPAEVRAQLRNIEKMAKDPAVRKVREAVRKQGDQARAYRKSPTRPNTDAFRRREYDAAGNEIKS